MSKLDNEVVNFINNHKNISTIEYNKENFYTKDEPLRYATYVNRYLFSNVSDVSRIINSVRTTSIGSEFNLAGVYFNDNEVSCVIPERKCLLDEMICIHELTHLINYLESGNNNCSIYDEVIPFFNEYDYAKKIHPFYGKCYEQFRFNKAVNAAKNIGSNDFDYYKDAIKAIYAYLLLNKKKDDYDIKT